MPDTVTCPRCSRTVPWTAEEWNGAEECCAQCVSDSRVKSALSDRAAGTGMRLTGVSVPFGDVLVLVFKVAFASLLVGALFGAVYFLVKLVLELNAPTS